MEKLYEYQEALAILSGATRELLQVYNHLQRYSKYVERLKTHPLALDVAAQTLTPEQIDLMKQAAHWANRKTEELRPFMGGLNLGP